MRNSIGCERCAVRGLFVPRTIHETSQGGVYSLTSATSGEQQLVVPGVGRVCAGSTLEEGKVPAFDALIQLGERVDVTVDRAGVARKLGPIATTGGHVCVILNPFRQADIDGLPFPEPALAHA